jgi:hypothetical protein
MHNVLRITGHYARGCRRFLMTTARAAATARAVAAAASEMPVEPELSSFALAAGCTWPAEAKEEGSSR